MIEYKIRPVTRFVVTRYSDDLDPNGKNHPSSDVKGVFDNFSIAYNIGYALAREEFSRRAIDLQDPGFVFPASIVYQEAKRFDIIDGEKGSSEQTELSIL
jgi:hypothetical protein